VADSRGRRRAQRPHGTSIAIVDTSAFPRVLRA
jgi:hypothetical protein